MDGRQLAPVLDHALFCFEVRLLAAWGQAEDWRTDRSNYWSLRVILPPRALNLLVWAGAVAGGKQRQPTVRMVNVGWTVRTGK